MIRSVTPSGVVGNVTGIAITLVAMGAAPLPAAVRGPVEEGIFPNDFETGECELWSATSNPLGAPDVDEDSYGNEFEPAAWCQLPAGWAADTTDCNDLAELIHPGADELCNGLDDDCDDAIDDGLLGDTNPACGGAPVLGDWAGDVGSAFEDAKGQSEAWFLLSLREQNETSTYLSATVYLDSPAGSDFDLYLYCFSCGGSLVASSTLEGLKGHTDSIEIRADDDFLISDDFVVFVEVRRKSSNRCVEWTLEAYWNTTVSVGQNCDP